MGIFDKAKAAREEQARKEEMRRQEIERSRQEAENKRFKQIEYLESSDLVLQLSQWIREMPWFFSSQGTWDSNRRQVIITPSIVFVNNYDDPFDGMDYFFSKLNSASYHNDSIVSYGHEKKYNTFPEGRLPDEATACVEALLDRYKEADYTLKMNSYEALGYKDIPKESIELIAEALMNAILKGSSYMESVQVNKNKSGFIAFEFNVPPIQLKEIFPAELF